MTRLVHAVALFVACVLAGVAVAVSLAAVTGLVVAMIGGMG